MDGTRFNTSAESSERNWVIHVSSPCLSIKKSGCPTTSYVYICIYCRSTSWTTKKLHGSAWGFFIPMASPGPSPKNQGGDPPATRRPPYPWLNGPGWTGGIFGSSEKVAFFVHGWLILSGYQCVTISPYSECDRISKAGKKGFFQELLLEASSRHLIH